MLNHRLRTMLKISNFNIDYTIKSVRDRIAAAKLKIKKRRFLWAISILNEAIFEIKHICESHPKEYQNLLRKIYETIGDSYFALKKSDLAFDCYLAAYHLKNNLVLNKILFISQIYGQYLSSENAMLGFLLLLSSKNSFPGSRKDNEEFAKKIIDLTKNGCLVCIIN